MSTSTIENPLPVNSGESKSARKKKAKASATNGTGTPTPTTTPAVPDQSNPTDNSNGPEAETNGGSYEHPHLKELQKQIRSLNKKLGGMQKTDAVLAENPGVSLDDLVAQRKLNSDQRAAAEKKPGMQAQVQQLEEQVQVFRTVNADYQAQMQKQKDEVSAQHQRELEKMKDDTRLDGLTSGASELRKKLLVLSQFLRAAAAKRTIEEDAGSDENMAFEGALLLIYGGDEKAVDTAVSLIDGSDEQVPSIDGVPLSIQYSQIKQASIDHAPFQNEEAWVDQVEEANAAVNEHITPSDANNTNSASDPTLVNAGLTELDASAGTNGAAPPPTDSLPQTSTGDEGGNLAGDHWDTGAGAAAEDDSYEMVPRPNEEVDTPAAEHPHTAKHNKSSSGAVEDSHDQQPSGNQAGEAWDLKPAGDQGTTTMTTDNSWAAEVTAAAESAEARTQQQQQPADDGFQAVGGGRRGRGGPGGPRGGRGEGEFRGGRGGGRGRGSGFRGGDGGRGGGRGGRGRGGDGGEFRGRGGRGGRGRGEGGAPRGGEGGAPRGAAPPSS